VVGVITNHAIDYGTVVTPTRGKIAVRDIWEVPTFVGSDSYRMTNLVGVRRFQPSLESDYLKLISLINSWQQPKL
jgi:hypothetical protein